MRIRHLQLASLVALVLALALAAVPVLAAVSLVSFTAVPGNAQVLLRWETATEFNNAGFFIQRSLQETGTYQRVSSFIPSTGDGMTGGSYSFTDPGLTNGTRYYYKLEAVNSDQSTEMYGPIQATPAAVAATSTPSPTVTFTSQPNPSITPTPTTGPTATPTWTAQPAATRTRTPTATRFPTSTSAPIYSYPDTPTPRPSPTRTVPATQDISVITVAATVSSGPTSTWVPFPAITVVVVLQDTPQAASVSSPEPPNSSGPNLVRLAPLGVILLIWVLLGGWFFYSFRRMT
ncbi:MAG TPA: hypothetical protein VF498_01575 [Anaerolineales bacterium]